MYTYVHQINGYSKLQSEYTNNIDIFTKGNKLLKYFNQKFFFKILILIW